MFDIKFLYGHLGIRAYPECTKILMKILHPELPSGLGSALRDILGVTIDKGITHDWGVPELSDEQIKYACQDVLYLHRLYKKLRETLGVNPKRANYYEAMSTAQGIAELEVEGYTDLFKYEQDPYDQVKANRDWWDKQE